jgi:hypothetical protein
MTCGEPSITGVRDTTASGRMSSEAVVVAVPPFLGGGQVVALLTKMGYLAVNFLRICSVSSLF